MTGVLAVLADRPVRVEAQERALLAEALVLVVGRRHAGCDAWYEDSERRKKERCKAFHQYLRGS
jgi:hypothetical protein